MQIARRRRNAPNPTAVINATRNDWRSKCTRKRMTMLSHHPTKTKAMHEALRQLPYALYAVGVGATPQRENAFMASWVMQCSFEPPLIAVGVRKGGKSFQLLQNAGVFTVNLLSKNQTDLARRLVKPANRTGDKLGQISHYEEVTGAPLIRDAIAFLECRVVSSLDSGGDHMLFVGEVVNAGQGSAEPPLTCSDIGWTYAG